MSNFLFKKVHRRYKFPTIIDEEDPDYDPVTDPYLADVNSKTLVKMSTDLSSWKCRVRKRTDKGESFKTVHKAFLMINEE